METSARVNILGTQVTLTNPQEALAAVMRSVDAWRGRYIVACNVHAVVTAHDDAEFRAAENGAVMALPDGKPLSIVSRLYGHASAGHVPITSLMESVLAASTERGSRHFFYGSTAQTQTQLCECLRRRFPGITVAGSEPSVFRPMTQDELQALYARINDAAPDFVWIGLGVPRQELFMQRASGKVHALMLGVGGAFDVLAGNVKRAPQWMQKACLEWLYRLLQEPGRLMKRYVVTNTRFLWLLMRERGK